MGAAFFIVLDNANPGFDTFVNGKAIARDAQKLSKLAKSLGVRAPEEYFAMSVEDAKAIADESDLDTDLSMPPEQWFSAEEGLIWVTKLRAAIESNLAAVSNPTEVLNDLTEYDRVFSQAHAIGAKWHFSIDF